MPYLKQILLLKWEKSLWQVSYCSIVVEYFLKKILLASQKLNVTREATDKLQRMTTERGNIVIDVNKTESEETVYNAK